MSNTVKLSIIQTSSSILFDRWRFGYKITVFFLRRNGIKQIIIYKKFFGIVLTNLKLQKYIKNVRNVFFFCVASLFSLRLANSIWIQLRSIIIQSGQLN